MTDELTPGRPAPTYEPRDQRVHGDPSELSAYPPAASNHLWYRDAVIYQMHVKAFHDSTGDGVGDFAGLTQRLDYIQELGVNTIWLLPFYPSPQRDDGYDIADYCNVHPDYGTLDEFREFIQEAHRRDLKVITELVINHTSEQHPWFQAA
ncbi:MAG: alpha-amylase family glycosyl hydrolase, partial [Steroidobacter sp.]